MAEQIIDGAGSGRRAAVNVDNMLLVMATSVPVRHHSAHVDNQAYTINVQQTPSGANTAFMSIKNGAMDMNIWSLSVHSASSETVEVWSVTGTAAGTDNQPVNVVVGSGKVADATCTVGAAVTGLTKNKLLRRFFIEGGKTTARFPIEAAIIIMPQQQIALYAVTGSAQVSVTLSLDFHPQDYKG